MIKHGTMFMNTSGQLWIVLRDSDHKAHFYCVCHTSSALHPGHEHTVPEVKVEELVSGSTWIELGNIGELYIKANR